MKYKIWDKKEKINNVEAEHMIKSLNVGEEDNVFLIIDDSDNVQCVEIDRIIKSVYELDANLTVEEVAEEYIRIREEEKAQQEINENSVKEQASKLSTLEEELALIQDALNELIFNMMDGE